MKNTGKYLCISALVMLLIPFLVVSLVQSDGALLVVLMLFFVLNPFVSLMLGLEAGKSARQKWYLPAVNAMLFLAGAWLNFDLGDTAFFYYVGIYLVIGYGAMVLRMMTRKMK